MSIASDNNLLWLPPDLNDLLTVSVDWAADTNTVDGMNVINGAAGQWLAGLMDDYTYFELLDHYAEGVTCKLKSRQDMFHSFLTF